MPRDVDGGDDDDDEQQVRLSQHITSGSGGSSSSSSGSGSCCKRNSSCFISGSRLDHIGKRYYYVNKAPNSCRRRRRRRRRQSRSCSCSNAAAATSKKTEKVSPQPENNHHLATCTLRRGKDDGGNDSLRRSTLSELIELFERKVQLNKSSAAETSSIKGNGNNSSKTRLISCKINKQQKPPEQKRRSLNASESENMRDIITPVSYDHEEPSSSTSTSTSNETEEREDSLEEIDLVQSSQREDKQRHRISIKGVPVLPAATVQFRPQSKTIKSKQPSVQRLTKTNWQPPTDARKYDRLLTPTNLSPAICHRRAASSRQTPNPANLGPSIVKHQPSSSRRLLSQLARARKQTKPSYQVKRPEKVAQVEELIEQLERATAEWEEDESLLDRAERRDWPLEYHKRYSANSLGGGRGQQTSAKQPIEQRRADFGRRADVPSIERESVASSHKQINMISEELPIRSRRPASSYLPSAFADRYYDDLAVRRLSSKSCQQQADNKSAQTTMSYLLCSNAYTPSQSGSMAGDDLHYYDSLERRVRADDLQFRQYRAKNRLEPHEPPFGIPRQPASASVHSSASHYLRQQQQSSSSATTKSYSTLPTRVCHCTTSPNPTVPVAVESPGSKGFADRKRADSRVSFLEDRTGGVASADSGLAGGSPVFSDGTRASFRLATPITDKGAADEELDDDDAAEEIDLGELWRADEPFLEDGDPSRCESPAVERFKAELRATPVRRRPKINIERPRAKSPLLRVSSKPPPPATQPSTTQQPAVATSNKTTKPPVLQIGCYEDKPISEIECRFDFADEEDDDCDDNQFVGGASETFDAITRTQKPKYITTNLDSSSSEPNESSLERLNYRAGQQAATAAKQEQDDTRSKAKKKQDGPIFSIGEYKPLNKPHLKIL